MPQQTRRIMRDRSAGFWMKSPRFSVERPGGMTASEAAQRVCSIDVQYRCSSSDEVSDRALYADPGRRRWGSSNGRVAVTTHA
jgi:hypothetical protein